MLHDASEVPDGSLLTAEVCVVGAGVAGLTVARDLAADGVGVCVLESGRTSFDREARDLARGEVVGHPYYALHRSVGRRFGGSANRWLLKLGDGRRGARLRPLDPIDFERRSAVPHSGWPFGIETLDPWYRRAHLLCEAGEYRYDPADRKPSGTRWLHEESDRIGSVIYHFVARDVFRESMRDEMERSAAADVYLGATLLEVETDPEGTEVSRLRVATPDGRTFFVEAATVVLAMGGIEVPRVLLLSRGGRADGLGNAYGLVGRFFMEHPHSWIGFYRPPDRTWVEDLADYSIHADGDGVRVAQLTVREEVLREEGLLNFAVHLVAGVPSARVRPHVRRARLAFGRAVAAARGTGGRSTFHHLADAGAAAVHATEAAVRYPWVMGNRIAGRPMGPHGFRLNTMAEQAPDPGSRVTLGDDRDRFGRPRPRLDWKLSDLDLRSLQRCQDIVDEELRRAGLGRIEFPTPRDILPRDVHGGWHHMGTTRMHVDPKRGVVDAEGRVHGVGNLYVAGPSVFPTGGCANPVLTVMALSLRLADHLKRRRPAPLDVG